MPKQAMYLAASNGVGTGEISYRLRDDLAGPHERRGLNSWTVGANDSADPEPAARERIRHVFLPPLRDAQQALASGSGDRVECVMKALAANGEIETLEASAAAAFDNLSTDPLVVRARARRRPSRPGSGGARPPLVHPIAQVSHTVFIGGATPKRMMPFTIETSSADQLRRMMQDSHGIVSGGSERLHHGS